MTAIISGLNFHKDKMHKATSEGFLLATDAADYLAKKGLPFREAHEVVGSLVRLAIKKGCGLEDLDLATLKKHSQLFDHDIKNVLSMKASVNARTSIGGTATSQVKKELIRAKKMLNQKN